MSLNDICVMATMKLERERERVPCQLYTASAVKDKVYLLSLHDSDLRNSACVDIYYWKEISEIYKSLTLFFYHFLILTSYYSVTRCYHLLAELGSGCYCCYILFKRLLLYQ